MPDLAVVRSNLCSAHPKRRHQGLRGVVVGQGDPFDEALSDVKSAIRFHIEAFGEEVLEATPPVIEPFVFSE